MSKESLIEQALLEAEQLENTMRSNAKEILASTMKEEIGELVQESLAEKDDYLKEQTEEDIEDETLDFEGSDDDAEEMEMSVEIPDLEDEMEDDELAPLDLTSATDDEVIKVFKAMGDEDGIIVKKDEDEISLQDGEDEYLIKLEENKNMKTKKSNLKEMEKEMEVDELMMDEESPETDETTEMEEEVMYEIELSDEDEDKSEETKEDAHEEEMEEGHMHHKFKQGYDARQDDSLGDLDGPESSYSQSFADRRREREGMRKSARRTPDMLNAGKKEVGEMVRQNNLGQKVHAGNRSNSYNKAARKKSGIHLPESRRKKARISERARKVAQKSSVSKNYGQLKEEITGLKSKNFEYKKALSSFRDKLNEVGVFNSNLAYATRLFTEHSTTKQEKINILKRFDNVQSLKESKSLYKVIKEELSTVKSPKTKKTISEAVEKRINKSPRSGSKSKLTESKVYENPQFSRIKDLINKIN